MHSVPDSGKPTIFGVLRPIDWLLLAVPVAFAIRYVPGWNHQTLLFLISGVGIIPLAGWMGRATEHLGERAGPGIGGLLNATFGNAAELIIGLMALSKGLTGVVKASITGSIIGNILLVVGASLLAGGIRYPRQTFNQTAARISSTSLSLAAIGLTIPTIFHWSAAATPAGWSPDSEQKLSLAIAGLLLVTYLLWLLFSLVTHKGLFNGEDDGDPENDAWSIGRSTLILAGATILVAFMSEFLVGSIEAARHALGLSEVFVGVIVVATVGNAAEHSTAVVVALKNKMDLSLGIATGSSIQIALFVTPVLLFASYFFGQPMNLEFSLPEVVAVGVAVAILVQICGDGECNWLEGAQLLSVYLIIAVLFYFLPESTQEPMPNSAPKVLNEAKP
ncbi:calcium/proton exchanger [Luteolibacter pohnpeiensis]|uniref:Ca(2+)/H(+) antiporter n=1 Tax=Luteolibacter pohnpeiensis TaxID=454153 RepID=A0A934VVC2_9BACT|nr:calcium/proton exchanger [Luteolibacter pohnpeiensis]MBK1882035.1 calcium/proton exchanger [Luteolibacter pohnpeiensis]